jgi:phenylpyruvate tautomerase PptA (4-oxalocrotonate tautomerase family)
MGPPARFVKEVCRADHSYLAARREARGLPAGDLRWPYRAMRETLNVPEDDQFMTMSEHDAANFRTGTAYGVARSADVVYIRLTVFNTRTAEQKKALFKRTAELLGENPGIRPEDVFIVVVDSARENWSVGNGVAQFA